MHSAPSVSYPVGRSFFLAGFMLLVWLAGTAAVVLWLVSQHPSWARVLTTAAVVMLAGALAVRNWLATAVGELRWDGQSWSWRGQPVTVEAVVLDLQGCLLLYWRGAGAGHGWLWLERSRRPDRWSDLRRAVYSRPRIDATPFPPDVAQP